MLERRAGGACMRGLVSREGILAGARSNGTRRQQYSSERSQDKKDDQISDWMVPSRADVCLRHPKHQKQCEERQYVRSVRRHLFVGGGTSRFLQACPSPLDDGPDRLLELM